MSEQNGAAEGRVALVTGGSRGLGESVVRNLAGRGTDVIFTYRSSEDEAEALVAEVEGMGWRAAALRLDVGEAGAFGAFAEEVRGVLGGWGMERFHYLVNNAGIGLHAPFAETTEEQFDELVRVQLKAPFFLTQKLLPLISDGGRILNVSTGLARFTLPGHAAYAATKGGVEVLTRYMAKELGGRRIRVNVIAPGAIETDFGGGMVRDNPQANGAVAASTALGRAGLPEDVGGAVAAILSDELGWANGTRIEVSGGQNL